MTTISTEPVGLLRALDATSLKDAIAQLDGLLRLADNAADELGLLCASTDGFPCPPVADMFDRAARVVEDAAAELRALRRRLSR